MKLLACTSLTLTFLGCASSSGPEVQTAFGGQGAVVDGPDSFELPEQEQEATLSGPCRKPAPAGVNPLIDNFEDGDHQLFKTFHREGWWYTSHDGSDGVTIFPEKGEFKGTALPETEATPNNEVAAHFRGEGAKDWGMLWGTTLNWKHDGLSCPYNASQFEGMRLRARGSGEIFLKFATVATVPPEHGGVCKEQCWDMHGKVLRMKDEWTTYVIRFDELQQNGFGTDAEFDPKRVTGIQFAADPKSLPVDFWIDDIRFLKPGEADTLLARLAQEQRDRAADKPAIQPEKQATSAAEEAPTQ